MNSPSGLPVRTTEPTERSSASEPSSSSSSATITRFMKLCGGLSKLIVSTRPARAVSNVRGIWVLLRSCLSGAPQSAERLADPFGDSAVKLDVGAAVDGDLDQPGALRG